MSASKPAERCKRCGGKIRQHGLYQPYCSFHCQEWARVEAGFAYLREREEREEQRHG